MREFRGLLSFSSLGKQHRGKCVKDVKEHSKRVSLDFASILKVVYPLDRNSDRPIQVSFARQRLPSYTA